jgi:hypothetical protein
LANARRTVTAAPPRSTSRHSAPNASSGRKTRPCQEHDQGGTDVVKLRGDRVDLVPILEWIELAHRRLLVLDRSRDVSSNPSAKPAAHPPTATTSAAEPGQLAE